MEGKEVRFEAAEIEALLQHSGGALSGVAALALKKPPPLVPKCLMVSSDATGTGDNPITAAAIAAQAGVDEFVAEANDESDDHCQQQVQSHVRFLACWLPLRPVHDVEPGAITPSTNNTNPANRPKKPINRKIMSAIGSTCVSLTVDPSDVGHYSPTRIGS
jgi:hypothetical protein